MFQNIRYNYIGINILRSVLFGIMYSIIEVNVPFDRYISHNEYVVLYYLIFIIGSITPNIRIWVANAFLSVSMEDIWYWVIKGQTPFSYAWYYPVYYVVPIVDVIEIVISVLLYTRCMYMYNILLTNNYVSQPHDGNSLSYKTNKCDMIYYFTHGKTHDIYGLLFIAAISVFAEIVSTSIYERIFALDVLIVAVGLAVDLWSHCFSH